MQQNPSSVLALVFQIFVLCCDCYSPQKQHGYKRVGKPSADFAIIYNSVSACGAAFLNARYLMSGYTCINSRLGTDGEQKKARNTIKPYIIAKVIKTDTCGAECGVVLVKIDKHLISDPSKIVFSNLHFNKMPCTRAELLCASVKKPFKENSIVEVYHKRLKPIQNTSECWSEDDNYYKNKYLCAAVGPVSQNATAQNVTVCNQTDDKWSDTDLFLDGPYLCHGDIHGFFSWNSCDSNGHLAIGNLTKFKKYFVSIMSRSRGRSEEQEGGDAKKPSDEEDVQKTMEDVTNGGSSKKDNFVKIWILSTMTFLLRGQQSV